MRTQKLENLLESDGKNLELEASEIISKLKLEKELARANYSGGFSDIYFLLDSLFIANDEKNPLAAGVVNPGITAKMFNWFERATEWEFYTDDIGTIHGSKYEAPTT